MIKIKICGVKTAESALAAAEAGADFIGLVFAPSPRQVTPAQAQNIVETVKKQTNVTKFAGVFVNIPASIVNSTAELCSLDYVQLSGHETLQYCREIKPAIIRAIRISHLDKADQVNQGILTWTKTIPRKDNIFLLDAYNPDKYGGTGELLDWETAAQVAKQFPVIVAGGLNPDNVSEAIRKIKPWGVDVSSGVETGGEKDVNKIKAFIKAGRTEG